MTVKEAAKILGISQLTLRVALQDPESPWYSLGWAYKKPGSKNWTYGIIKNRLEEFMGIKL